jgi:hypothetical protein
MRAAAGRGIVASMPPAARHLDLRTLRAAAVTGDGEVLPLPHLTAGTLTWPFPHAHRVLHEWRAWVETAEGVVRSGVRLARSPRGGAVVAVDVALAGDAGSLDALRRLEPAIDSVRRVAPAAVALPPARLPAGTAALTARLRLRELPPAAVDAFAAAAGPGSGSELLSAELHRIGGGYAVVALGAARGEPDAERVRIALAQLRRRLAPWA